MRHALITIDFINDIVHRDGRIAASAGLVEKRGVLDWANELSAKARKNGDLVCHVGLVMDREPSAALRHSPLFQRVLMAGACLEGTWGVRFHEDLVVESTDLAFRKNRVGAFSGNDLLDQLRAHDVSGITLCGVSTEMTVLTTARMAHDLDFTITIDARACGSSAPPRHQAALDLLRPVAVVLGEESDKD